MSTIGYKKMPICRTGKAISGISMLIYDQACCFITSN